jgi:hypothetical protein
MYSRALLVAVLFGGCALQAGAANLEAVRRGIVKQPAYQGAPRYCLLLFGKDAQTRIWLVQDGTTLYVDRKGNGDLTEPANRITSPHGTYFTVDRLVERDGTVHSNLIVNTWGTGQFTLRLGNREEREQYVGIGRMDRPTWGDKPETAPVIHFNGPLTLERYGPVNTLPRTGPPANSRAYKLRLMLGTPGLGKGTFASYNEACSENLGPIQADIEYPALGPVGKPIKERIELLHDG